MSDKIEKLVSNLEEFAVYAVMNDEGDFFRAKGYGGYGKSWVSDLSKARLYGSIGPAKQVVTHFSKSKNYSGVPSILEIHAGNYRVIDQNERVETAKKKKEDSINRARLAIAKKNLEKAQRELSELNEKTV